MLVVMIWFFELVEVAIFSEVDATEESDFCEAIERTKDAGSSNAWKFFDDLRWWDEVVRFQKIKNLDSFFC